MPEIMLQSYPVFFAKAMMENMLDQAWPSWDLKEGELLHAEGDGSGADYK